MKQVPLNQPHATLVSLGIQTVVTSNHRIEPGTRVAMKANGAARKLPPGPIWEPLLEKPGGALLRAEARPLAFGVVVCTAVVTDCLPIVEVLPEENDGCVFYDTVERQLLHWRQDQERDPADLSDQLPYCDWTKRWAWLLADIEHDIVCPTCGGTGLLHVANTNWYPRCTRCLASGRVALPLDPKEMP